MRIPLWAPPPAVIELGQDDLHLWLVELDIPAPDVDLARRTLSPDEVERAGRFHFERDARRYVAAHAGLRSILARYTGLRPQDLSFQASQYGKPFLAPGIPYTHAALNFNLSHSGELGLVAVTLERRVGVDIEQVRPEFADGSIAQRFFSPGEVRALRALPPGEQTAAFFRCWTRKEAFVKARGEGLSLSLDSFDVAFAPNEPPALLRIAGEAREAHRWSLHAVPLPDAWPYEAAVAVEEIGARPILFRFLRNT